MRITIDIDDEEIRRLLAPLAQQSPAPQTRTVTRLLNVKEVADSLGIGRNVYELLSKEKIHSLASGRTRARVQAGLSRSGGELGESNR